VLPHPDILRGYQELWPEAAEQYFRWVQAQSQHRMALENKITDSNIARSNRGQWFALTVSLAAMALAAYCVYNAAYAVAATISVSDVAALAAVFLYGNERRVSELRRKERSIEHEQQ
jgi:uncharacterized membrane protein